jgi:murein DD-endopeptidase
VTPTRETFLAAVCALEGVAYRWGGKGPRGIDCSGLVTWALKVLGGPDLRQTHNSDRLWLELPELVEPQAGDLAFYGSKNDPSHVVVCLGGPHDAIIGANGGGRETTTLERADAQKACVKRKPTTKYRPDLLGYRSIEPLLRGRLP